MRYWDEMRTKYGFNDGEAVPDGADVCRTVYIRAVNQLAEQLGSKVRAAAYDRAGVHNGCLILFYDVNDLSGRTPHELAGPLDIAADEVLKPDEAMDEAIRQASLLDLDSFVQVSVDLSDDFEGFLGVLSPMKEGDPLMTEVHGQPQHIYPGGRVRLVWEVKTFDGARLPVGGEYVVTWIDSYPPLVGLAVQPGDPVLAMTVPDALVVVEIPAEVRAASENCDPIPPFHLRDMDDEPLDGYGVFYDWNIAQTAMRQAVDDLGQAVQIVNGYSNTVTSCNPDESE